MKRNVWFTALIVLSLLLVSLPSLAVEPGARQAEETLPVARPLGDQQPRLPGERFALELSPGDSTATDGTSAETTPQEVQADVNLILDDGSLDNGVGIGGTWEFIFLNRFTPDPGDFAFDLTEMQVYFENTLNSGVQVGDDIILVAYENTSGSTDPAVGSNWLASFPATVQALDAWNVYTLGTPVHFDGPGDVLLGVIALEKPGTGYWPASIDQTSSQGRSWAGWWATSPPPNPPTLPPTQEWTLIDNIAGLAGNWMIRGYGTYSTQTPRIELLPAAQKGRGQPTNVIQYDLTLYNYTGQAGYFNLSYTGHAWSVSGPSVIGPLAYGGSQTFQVSVTIPGDAACPDCDTVTVTAQAQFDPAFTDASTIETCVGEEWQTQSNTDAQGSHWLAYACTDAVGAAGTCFYFGGLVTSGQSQVITARSQKYDVASGTWTQIANLPTPVFGATAGYINGKVYVAGGFASTTAPWPPTGALQIYDVASNSWSTGPALPTPRGGASSGVIGGKFYVAGGQDTQYAYCSLHEYNPATNSWTSKAPIPDLRCPSFGGGTASADRLFVAGDYWGENWFSAYDPATNTWDILGNLPGSAGKKSPVLAAAPDCGGVFLYGGDLGDWSGIQDTTWYWHPLVDVWTDYGALLNQRTTGGGGGLVDGRLWTFAGSQGAGPIVPPPHESLNYCCPAAPPAGSIEGTVTDADSGLPLENANVFLTRVGDLAFEVSTWTDASGYYHFGPMLVDDYELRAAAFGYYNQNTVVSVTDGVTATVNFALDLSVPDLSPTSVATTLQAGHTGTVAVTLSNNGTGDLHYHVSELPAGTIYPVPPAVQDLPSGLDPQLAADTAAAVDGTASFIVYLAEQADLSEAFTIQDRSARGHYVLDALWATAERTQAGLKTELDRAGAKYESRYIVNALVVRGNLDLAQRLAARPEVAYVSADHAIPAPEPVEVQPQAVTALEAVEWNIAKVRADAAWNSFSARGKGVVVANIDTGVQWDHPALVNQYRGGLAGNHDYNWWDPYGYGPTAPYDFHSHGSHTMGTMVGGEGVNQIGMAPAAKWFACQGFDQNTGSGYEKELLECAEFILAPWDLTGANPDPDQRADVVNNSWGGGQAQWWYSQAIYAWQAAGIFPAFSAGNDGPACDTAGDPGDMVNIMAVGATDTSDSNAPGTAADFSSRGPAKITGALKPNVSAPGANIRSAYNNGGYGFMSGTSMASPHVAGEAALIWSAQPALWGNVQLTYWLIQQSATPLVVNQGYTCGLDTVSSVPNNQYGWGRIDAFEAVDMALAANWDIPWLKVAPANGVVVPAGNTDVVLTFDATGLTPGQCYSADLLFNYNEPYVTEAYLPVELCVNPVHIAKTAAPLRQAAGQDVTYTIVFGNNGTPLTGVVVSDTLPTQVDFVSATLGGTYDAGNHEVVWSGLDLGTGSQFEATVVVTIKGDIPNCTDINNQVYLDYGGPAPLSDTAYHSSTCYFLYLPLIGKDG